MTENEYKRALDVALKAGEMLLESGAEIRRVEETVVRIASHFGMDVKTTVYSLTTALFVAAEIPGEGLSLSKVLQAPMKRMRLNHLVRLNQLSRDISADRLTLVEAEKKIGEIASEPDTPFPARLLASFLASFCFAFMFGGNVTEALVAAAAGASAFLFVSGTGGKISKIIANFLGGLLFSMISILFPALFPNAGLRIVVILLGAMMPLVPGVSFMNSFRDFANDDYLSGIVRFLDAVLIGVSLAGGAVVPFLILTLVKPEVVPDFTVFATVDTGAFGLLLQAGVSFFATFSFAAVFQCPRKYLVFSGIPGVAAWISFLLLKPVIGLGLAMFASALLLTLVARCFSVGFRCPLTVFLVAGIIPLVPGSGVFLAAFELMLRDFSDALQNAWNALLTCGGILLGISFISMIPQRVFNLLRKKEHKHEGARNDRP